MAYEAFAFANAGKSLAFPLGMNEIDFQNLVRDAIYYENAATKHRAAGDIQSIESFADRGVLTSNAGLVIRLTDGSEFQITIVKSK